MLSRFVTVYAIRPWQTEDRRSTWRQFRALTLLHNEDRIGEPAAKKSRCVLGADGTVPLPWEQLLTRTWRLMSCMPLQQGSKANTIWSYEPLRLELPAAMTRK